MESTQVLVKQDLAVGKEGCWHVRGKMDTRPRQILVLEASSGPLTQHICLCSPHPWTFACAHLTHGHLPVLTSPMDTCLCSPHPWTLACAHPCTGSTLLTSSRTASPCTKWRRSVSVLERLASSVICACSICWQVLCNVQGCSPPPLPFRSGWPHGLACTRASNQCSGFLERRDTNKFTKLNTVPPIQWARIKDTILTPSC